MCITMNKELANSLWDYRDGNLIWKNSNGSIKKGSIAGTKLDSGYIAVRYKGKGYRLSRLIYILHYGDIEEGKEIDHKDRDILNNNIGNLRCVSHSVNQKNKGMTKLNKSGYENISVTKHGTFRPHIKVSKKQISLKTYKTLQEAQEALNEAKIKYNYDMEVE